MKKLLALLLTLVLVTCMFASCSDSESGSDETTETTEATEAVFSLDGEWVAEMNLGELTGAEIDATVSCILTFEGDKCTMGFDADNYVDAMLEYTKTMAEAEGSTLDEMLEAQGMTEEDYKAALASTIDAMTQSGEYTLDGDTLTMFDETFRMETVSNDEIILTDSTDSPMTFKRA